MKNITFGDVLRWRDAPCAASFSPDAGLPVAGRDSCPATRSEGRGLAAVRCHRAARDRGEPDPTRVLPVRGVHAARMSRTQARPAPALWPTANSHGNILPGPECGWSRTLRECQVWDASRHACLREASGRPSERERGAFGILLHGRWRTVAGPGGLGRLDSQWRSRVPCSQGFRSSPGAFAAGDTRALRIGRAVSSRAKAIRPSLFSTTMTDLQ